MTIRIAIFRYFPSPSAYYRGFSNRDSRVPPDHLDYIYPTPLSMPTEYRSIGGSTITRRGLVEPDVDSVWSRSEWCIASLRWGTRVWGILSKDMPDRGRGYKTSLRSPVRFINIRYAESNYAFSFSDHNGTQPSGPSGTWCIGFGFNGKLPDPKDREHIVQMINRDIFPGTTVDPYATHDWARDSHGMGV